MVLKALGMENLLIKRKLLFSVRFSNIHSISKALKMAKSWSNGTYNLLLMSVLTDTSVD